jgi:hypothetical protein
VTEHTIWGYHKRKTFYCGLDSIGHVNIMMKVFLDLLLERREFGRGWWFLDE